MFSCNILLEEGVIMDKNLMWNNFLEKLSHQIDSLAFDTWFKDTKLINIENGSLVIEVPMYIHQKHIKENYQDMIINIINELTGTNFNIIYHVLDENNNSYKEINKGVPNMTLSTNLNKNYTFDNFIVGESNKFAHAAALSVAESPGKKYNPLFLYGNSGLGKTHLMHAIGNYIIKESNRKVLYVTSEQFRQDFINLNKKDKNKTNYDYIDFFKDKYRNIDVLIIDDIQFLSNATASQNEFFHTFNELYDTNKQIIISSDRSPDDLKLLEERLRTRFAWGLTANIKPPDYELRKEIVKKKMLNNDINDNISEEVIEYIINNLNSDVRQLEGAVTRLYAYSAMMNNGIIDLTIAKEALSDYMPNIAFEKNNITKIQRVIADFYQITVDDLKSKKRIYKISHPRQIAMYLCRVLTDETYLKIGLEFGGKDHTTIIHAYEKISNELKHNEELKKLIKLLTDQI